MKINVNKKIIKNIHLHNGNLSTDKIIYTGEVVNGLPHGFGQITTDIGIDYKGEWHWGKFHGKGILKTNDNLYNCTFNHGQKNGPGIAISKDGSLFKGYWKDDLRQGTSLTILKNNTKIKSFWIDDKPYHYEIRANNGNVYIGQLDTELRPHGSGIIRYASEDIYSGEFNHGIRQGYGYYNYKVGSFVQYSYWDKDVAIQVMNSYYF